MILGIDTHNLRSGGGKNYIIEILNNADSDHFYFKEIHIWGNEKILDRINENENIVKHYEKYLKSNNANSILSYFYRIYWHIFLLKKNIRKNNCDLVFFPGSYNLSGINNYVCINLNILPFEKSLLKKIGLNLRYFKFKLLKYLYQSAYKNSQGVIFLSNLAKKLIYNEHKLLNKNFTVIPLGLKNSFYKLNEIPSVKKKYIKIIYVSPFDFYKNQINVFFAIEQLSRKYNIKIYFIGSGNNKYAKNFKKTKLKIDPQNKFSTLLSNLSESELINFYHNADIKIFASETEALPTIILEAMGSRMPIACSDVEPMKSILKNAAIFFNPNKIDSIVNVLEKLIVSKDLRYNLSSKAFNLSTNFNWKDISNQTLKFIYFSKKK